MYFCISRKARCRCTPSDIVHNPTGKYREPLRTVNTELLNITCKCLTCVLKDIQILPLIDYCLVCLLEIAKIRMSAHKLNIELGRYNNIERSERICTLCDAKEIEDEYHFILQCPRYSNLSNAHIKQYYHRRPNVLKLVQLLSTTSIKELSNLGKYLERSNKLRNKLLEL